MKRVPKLLPPLSRLFFISSNQQLCLLRRHFSHHDEMLFALVPRRIQANQMERWAVNTSQPLYFLRMLELPHNKGSLGQVPRLSVWPLIVDVCCGQESQRFTASGLFPKLVSACHQATDPRILVRTC